MRASPLAFLLLALGGGCLFRPAIEEHGYTPCEGEEACAPGRMCRLGYCAPPPWHDDAFAARQLLVVENPAAAPLPKGAAVPVRVGAGGLLGSAELGVDGRFAYFHEDEARWEVVPIFRDVAWDHLDHLLVWIPLFEEVPPKGEGALAWLETQTAERQPTLLERPEDVFALFEPFDGDALDEERFSIYGTGTPIVQGGAVNVADNQRLVLKEPLIPPFSITFRGRVNGVTCDKVFLGVTSGDGPGFEPPSAGLFAAFDREAFLEVGPTEDSVPREVGARFSLETASHRYRLDIGDGRVRLSIDEKVLAEPELRPPFAGERLYARVEVDGACSFDLEHLYVSPLPFDAPRVRAEERVELELFD